MENLKKSKPSIFLPSVNDCNIAIIGLGYVGLPLAIEFARNILNKKLKTKVIGFDISKSRVKELIRGIDKTNQISYEDFEGLKSLFFVNEPDRLIEADVYIVTVPTPVDCSNKPNLKPLESASKTVAEAIKKRYIKKNFRDKGIPIVIYESTVFPGATEEFCVPILEENSGLKFNIYNSLKGFACGYSPERINPGDKLHTISSIIKVTSGSTEEVADWVDNLYSQIINKGTFKAKNIKTAEAAKVIENTQRDINIALVNELSIICQKMDIDTLDVLDAASTKWNFLNFKPGLVGGHCIGVDPYYLTYKAEQIGYSPKVVLSGRKLNNSMGNFIVDTLISKMKKNNINLSSSKVLIMGFTFKENCNDIRNTRVIDVINQIKKYKLDYLIYDPVANPEEVKKFYDENIVNKINFSDRFDALIVCVKHKLFVNFKSQDWIKLINDKGIIFDVKGIVPRELKPIRL